MKKNLIFSIVPVLGSIVFGADQPAIVAPIPVCSTEIRTISIPNQWKVIRGQERQRNLFQWNLTVVYYGDWMQKFEIQVRNIEKDLSGQTRVLSDWTTQRSEDRVVGTFREIR